MVLTLMEILVEYAWIIPLVIPFIVGLLVGVIVKRAAKLIIVLVALIIVLGAVGYTQLPTLNEILARALVYLPLIKKEAGVLLNLIIYSYTTFLIGLAIGLWKG
jgi:hypothetical protein